MSGEKKNASFTDKVKGAVRVVHGIGENIRGSVMGAVESASGSEEGKAKEEQLVTKGRSEIEKGLAQMKGLEVPGGSETSEATEDADTHAYEAAKSQPPTTSTPQQTTGAGGVSSQLPTSTTQAQGIVGADEPKSRQTVPDTTSQKQIGTDNLQGGQSAQLASPTKSSQMDDQRVVGEGVDATQSGSSVRG